MMLSLGSLVVLVGVASVHNVGGVSKTWVPNTNYDNAINWDLNRVPCETDRVIFPGNLQSAISLPEGSTIVKDLVLPTSGEIIFPLTGSLTITRTLPSRSNCPGEDVLFTRNWAEAWLDPANWKTEGVEASQPVPHMERIPCVQDYIHFPPASSFRVRLPEVPVTVGKISLLGQELSASEWEAVLISDSGERQFEFSMSDYWRTKTVEMTGEICEDPLECVCSVNHELQEAVCRNVKCDKTPLPCLNPVTPIGSCCPMCGSYLVLKLQTSGPGANILKTLLQSMLRKEEYIGTAAYMSRLADVDSKFRPQLQVVFSDTGDYRGDCINLANAFASKVKSKEYGIEEVLIYMAGEAMLGSTLGSVLGTVLGTLLAALTALAIIYLAYHQTRWTQPFVFARFENAPSEGEEALEGRMEVLSVEPPEALAAAFDNPMYGNTSKMEVTHENPVYSELKERDDKDDQE